MIKKNGPEQKKGKNLVADQTKQIDEIKESTGAHIHVAPSPHISEPLMTTRRMMTDVLIALLPLTGVAVYIFEWYAVKQLLITITACLAAEIIFVKMRGRSFTLMDCSAAVTGLILALSLPGTAPWYVGVLAAFVAMGIGKIIFGGLGMNIFNPAMVGRAFVMIAFASVMGASAYEMPGSVVDALSQATPLTALKQSSIGVPLSHLFWGTTNGSLGEVSAAACLVGGLFLCFRKTASWQIPASLIGTAALMAGLVDIIGSYSGYFLFHHLFGGALLFGAFFIATDPVTSPLTVKGKIIFGAGTGVLVMVLRLFSGYPEGMMFAILLMNGVTPLINRWTIPRPTGEV